MAHREPVIARLRASGCVFAEQEADLLLEAATTPAELDSLLHKRTGGEPIEHLLGWVEFAGMRLRVDPGVFVPRRRTQLLADTAVNPPGRQQQRTGVVLVELCCGAGAVSAVLATKLDLIELHAADIDPNAVRCARRNLPGGEVHEGDLDEPLPGGLLSRVDVLVANAPYVPSAAVGSMPPEARDHESRLALDGGADGLDVQRRVIAAAPRWLAPGGDLIIEVADHQAHQVARTIAAAGLTPHVVRDEEVEATAVVGRAGPAELGAGRGWPVPNAGT